MSFFSVSLEPQSDLILRVGPKYSPLPLLFCVALLAALALVPDNQEAGGNAEH